MRCLDYGRLWLLVFFNRFMLFNLVDRKVFIVLMVRMRSLVYGSVWICCFFLFIRVLMWSMVWITCFVYDGVRIYLFFSVSM